MAPISSHNRRKPIKIRKRTKKYSWTSIFDRNKALFSIIWVITSILLITLLIVIAFRQTILSEKYRIQQVEFAQSSINIYDHPQLYKDITTYLIGKNYFLTKRFGMEELHAHIISQHSIIQSIAIAQKDANIIFIEIAFHEPTLVFYTPMRRFALYERSFFDLTSGNSLGKQSMQINLPGYTSGYDNLNGILYEIDENKLINQLQIIENVLGSEHIGTHTYLPGGSKLIVDYKGKTIYFHLDKDINVQLSKISDLEKFYPAFTDLSVIDAGSIDDLIVR